ncbi:HWE histidine kinase domain-containing protein [Mesorhizobium sp. KR1-2]|uniref:sensor histidine kinase n=1 Tax=Mesorhizobium sp. KR1-2 TaxID=3156609 RepID=UPI0032B391C2
MLSTGEVDTRVRKLLTPNRAWILYLMFGAAYAALFMLGVYTANNAVLALVWPANAFMLGMLVRFPVLARPPGWIACLAGFAIALELIDYRFVVDAKLLVYNFGIVVIGYLLLSRLERDDQRLERPISVFYLFTAVAAASLFAGIAGSHLIGALFSRVAEVSAFRYWFSVELLNQLAFVPMILAFPEDRHWARELPLTLHDQAPIIVLIFSAVAGTFFGGIAALAFPIPALLWCAITYRVFLTALLTFSFCAWAIIATTLGFVDLSNFNQSLVLSISMGGALITLGPLIISTTTATRNEVLEQLRYLAAEREIVSNELEHRIKNLFALVNGLITLSVRDDPEMRPLANRLRNRLVALQQAHSLVQTGRASSDIMGGLASLKRVIGILLKPYEGSAAARFVVEGDEAFVDSGIVTPLALVFHELATNSSKYGALSDPDGTLNVDLSRDTHEMHIKWTETSSGLNGQAGSEAGFGSKLLDLTIKSQLQGHYTRKWTAGRMDIEIDLPGKLFRTIPEEPDDLSRENQRLRHQ